MVSEEKTFEIVNGRQTPDAGPWVSYKLTYEPLAQVTSYEVTMNTNNIGVYGEKKKINIPFVIRALYIMYFIEICCY